MRTNVRAALALCAALLVLSSAGGVALGQLTPVGGPTVQVFAGPTSVSEPTGGAFTLTTVGDVYTLKGDAHFQLPKNPSSPTFSAFVYGFQRVTVGPLPVQISPTAASNFKLVSGGGPVSTTFPQTTVNAGLGVLEFDSVTGTIPALFAGGANHAQMGNGFTVISETFAPGSVPTYVLGAGLTYELGLQYTLQFDLTGAPLTYPTIVTTLEAGGVSSWPGFSVDFNAVTVPEPSLTMSVAGMLMLLAAARRPTRRYWS